MSFDEPLERRLLRKLSEVAITTLSLGGRALLPLGDHRARGIERIGDLAYGPHPVAHRVDIYRPSFAHNLPVALYIHGGGFRMLSKETHWPFALEFAERGYLVFVINYRLAPRHPFPAALEDVARAYAWVLENAPRFGGDPSDLIVSGESAGANLTMALGLMTAKRFDTVYARRSFELDRVPDLLLPFAGIHQVSDSARIWRGRRDFPEYLKNTILSVEHAYLRGELSDEELPLANPLLFFESDESLERPFPPVFLSVGTRDPLLEDHRRLAHALQSRGVEVEAPIYPGGIHAFQAAPITELGQAHWRDVDRFLEARRSAEPLAQPAAQSASKRKRG